MIVNLCWDNRYHEWNQSIADSISFFAIQQMFNFSWTFVFNSYYKPRIDKWFVAPAVRYTFPGSQWYAEFGYIMYGGAKNKKWTSITILSLKKVLCLNSYMSFNNYYNLLMKGEDVNEKNKITKLYDKHTRTAVIFCSIFVCRRGNTQQLIPVRNSQR